MRGIRLELWLATTAVASVAAGLSLPVQSAPLTEDEISAAVPMPEPANLPPPTISDIAPPPSIKSPATPAQAAAQLRPAVRSAPLTEDEISAAVPMPEPANLPPPHAANIALPPSVGSPATAAQAATPTQPAAATPETRAVIMLPGATPAVATPAAATPEITPPAPAAAPAEAPVLTVDQRVAEKLHDIFGGKIDRILDRKSRAPVEAFYAARNYAPIWVENGAENARGKAAADYLGGIGADGLDPNDYPIPSFASAEVGALAEAELKLTATVLTYARHAQIGRVHYSRVSADIFYDLIAPEPGAVLGKLADAKDIAEALDGFNPPHAGYKALKAKLAEARARTGNPGRVRISLGKTLKPGLEDPRVPLLRERLGIAGDKADTAYDKELGEAVKTFQREHDLAPTGVLNNATVEALNGPRRDRDVDIIIANMER